MTLELPMCSQPVKLSCSILSRVSKHVMDFIATVSCLSPSRFQIRYAYPSRDWSLT